MQSQGAQLATKLHNTKLLVTRIRSTIGRPAYQREIVKILGLNRLNTSRIHEDSPRVWGLCNKTIHLIKLERIHADDPRALKPRK